MDVETFVKILKQRSRGSVVKSFLLHRPLVEREYLDSVDSGSFPLRLTVSRITVMNPNLLPTELRVCTNTNTNVVPIVSKRRHGWFPGRTVRL